MILKLQLDIVYIICMIHFKNFNNFENESKSFVVLQGSSITLYYCIYIFKENKLFGVGNKMCKLCSDKEYYVNEFSCDSST